MEAIFIFNSGLWLFEIWGSRFQYTSDEIETWREVGKSRDGLAAGEKDGLINPR